MISIRKSVDDLERVERLRHLCHSGYVNAIRAAADYAIELDPAHTTELRQNLQRLCEDLERAAEVEDYEAIQASLRGELLLYRDRSAEWLERMSRELQASALAMQSLAGSLNANGNEHEVKLAAGLRSLAGLKDSVDLAHVKKVALDSAASIGESWEELRRANQLVTAQLQDEIRSLHREVDNERRAMFTDASSGAWNREKLNLRIENNLRGDDAFCVVVAAVTNLKRLSATYSRGVIDGALQALVKRIHTIVGLDPMIGRWSQDQFAILLELNPGHAMAMSAEIAKQLLAPFSVQESGIARSIALRVTTSVAGRPLGSDAGHFRDKLAMLDGVQAG